MPGPGKYTGEINEWKCDRTENGCIQFIALLSLTAQKDQTGFAQIPPQEAIAYIMLTKLDGSKNVNQIENLQKALGWDGMSIKSLHNGDWLNKPISAVLENDTYNGVTKLKVKWLNPISGGGLRETDGSVIDQLEQIWTGVDRGGGNNIPI